MRPHSNNFLDRQTSFVRATPLTPTERRRLVKAGDKTQGALQSALIFANQHPEALPSNFDSAEFATDGNLLNPLQQVAAAIAQLNEDVQDTLLAWTATSCLSSSMSMPSPMPTIAMAVTTASCSQSAKAASSGHRDRPPPHRPDHS